MDNRALIAAPQSVGRGPLAFRRSAADQKRLARALSRACGPDALAVYS
jgi:hypothetical protein